MKFSLTLGQRRPLDRQTAWGCLTANLVGVPGLGSLAAGRRSGYGQMLLSVGGLAISGAFGVRFILWFISNSSQANQGDDAGLEQLGGIWLHLRWALLGIVIFVCGWLWALSSSLSILAEAKSSTAKPAPPIIKP
jgi:hypothetical protein